MKKNRSPDPRSVEPLPVAALSLKPQPRPPRRRLRGADGPAVAVSAPTWR